MNLQKHVKQLWIPVFLILVLACSFFLGRASTDKATSESQDLPPLDERQILYWQAPMDPSEIYDRPGKSKMGMDLIPVYEDEDRMDSGNTISVDPATVQNMGVRTGQVQRLDFMRTIRTIGEVQYDEEKLYLVNTKISGWIETLHAHFVGDQVQAGDPLLEIYSPELVTTQQEYVLALKNFRLASQSTIPSVREDAQKLLTSAQTRLEYWDIPESEIDYLAQTGEVRKTIVISAPVTGIVVARNAIEGGHVEVGEDLFKIADLRTVWVHASFYDNEVPWISNGQRVEMQLSYLPGKTYTGRVSYVYPYLRESARDVHVRLIFSNPDLDLKPGMYANIQLQSKVIPDAIVVPSEAVIRSGARAIIFVVHDEGRFEPREILLGEEGGPNNNYIRILSGLRVGEEIVISAQFMLDSESRLQEAIRKMLHGQTLPESTPEDEGSGVPSNPSKPAEHLHH
ncbi:MAG: efflux RND transporter periplasmic adaptor subunit [Bacteroidetes bacterium]|nr:efflux RND transporter periplasmic adaptor subunit [Bacteroidota bacterium]MCY4205781.1 efflux RND transporter periplasmic adaptor subunit [Bacteroidota bacterium]